jgi:predicted nuclease with RNAse H fold
MLDKVLFGIDYGSKRSGNTVIALFNNMRIDFLDAEKGVDADAFIRNAVNHYKPSLIFLDAPLSLPGKYFNIEGCSCYHFRKADSELKAMSPMFLGGLTARAIELKDDFAKMGIEVIETYPKAQATRFDLKKLGYKTNPLALRLCVEKIADSLHSEISICRKEITTWHHFDALLALISAMYYLQGKAQVFGCPKEGQIIV